MSENPGYLKLRKIKAAQSIAHTVRLCVTSADQLALLLRYLKPKIESI